MTTLSEFLLARIAEDEAAARMRNIEAPIHFLGCYYYSNQLEEFERCDCDGDGKATARVLAECEAKRRIVGYCKPMVDWGDGNLGEAKTGTAILSMLAIPYADHPDYQQEWKAMSKWWPPPRRLPPGEAEADRKRRSLYPCTVCGCGVFATLRDTHERWHAEIAGKP